MKSYSKKLGLDFLVTPFSKEEADILVNEIGVDFIKIASMDCNNYDFIEYIGKKIFLQFFQPVCVIWMKLIKQ